MSMGEVAGGLTTPATGSDGPTLLVDAHVHFHDCFDPDRFLTAAADNFRQAGDTALLRNRILGVLMLTEEEGMSVFERWRRVAGRPGGPWAFRRTDETCSLIAVGERGADMLIVAGQQIRTEEGLEVLAHGTTRRVPDGVGFRETVERTMEEAMAVSIPWGFGKWWPPRGRLVAEVMEGAPRMLFLADSGGRPPGLGRAWLFRAARSASRPVLAGSDPLPFPDHENRAGSFGFRAPGSVDRSRPAESVAALLRDARAVEIYGEARPLRSFVRDQVRLLARRRGGPDAPEGS